MFSLLSPIANLTNRIVRQPGLTFRQLLTPQRPWWIKVHTQNPACIYYFGPFESRSEARISQAGYVEDLEQENAQNIRVEIDQFSPQQLTVDDAIPSSLVR